MRKINVCNLDWSFKFLIIYTKRERERNRQIKRERVREGEGGREKRKKDLVVHLFNFIDYKRGCGDICSDDWLFIFTGNLTLMLRVQISFYFLCSSQYTFPITQHPVLSYILINERLLFLVGRRQTALGNQPITAVTRRFLRMKATRQDREDSDKVMYCIENTFAI